MKPRWTKRVDSALPATDQPDIERQFGHGALLCGVARDHL